MGFFEDGTFYFFLTLALCFLGMTAVVMSLDFRGAEENGKALLAIVIAVLLLFGAFKSLTSMIDLKEQSASENSICAAYMERDQENY